jgi:hypothetical protein
VGWAANVAFSASNKDSNTREVIVKKLLILVSILALSACSSKDKEEDMSNTEEAAAVEQPAETADTTPTPEPEPAEDSSADSASADMSSGEPDMADGQFPDVEGTERSGATCKNGSTERLVSVIDTREGPCGVVYTKNGTKRTVAYAKYDMSYCDKVFDNIVGNLTAGGYDCGGAGNTASAGASSETSEEDTSDQGTAEGDNAAEKN